MTRMLGAIALLLLLATPAIAGEPVSQTFAASPEKAWSVTESVLKQLGWDIDKSDQSNGWINTESRSVNGEDYGVYAKGARHRLVIRFKAAGTNRTTVTVERPLGVRSEEHTSELQSPYDLVCRLLLEKKKSIRAGSTLRGA